MGSGKSSRSFTAALPAGTHVQRLDTLIHEELSRTPEMPCCTRSQLKLLIEAGKVSINGAKVVKAGASVRSGDRIFVELDLLPSAELEPYDLELSIKFEDECLLVIDKPPGLTMHPGAGNSRKTLVNALARHLGTSSYGKMGGLRPGIVHRLDRNTSGLVVVAKDVVSQEALSKQFAARTVERAYQALVFSTPRATRTVRREDSGEITTQLKRDPRAANRMKVAAEGGREAITCWRVLERLRYATLLEVRLKTGRTHQIRVHMDHIGCPVIGDKTYGDFSALPPMLRKRQEKFGRQALHAVLLGFVHPKSGDKLRFTSDLPADFETLLCDFRAFKG